MSVALFLALAQSASLAEVSVAQLAPAQRAENAASIDVDGDGVRELVIAVRVHDKPFARSLEIWKRSGASYGRAQELALTRDVVAWAAGDVLEAPGTELVLFNQSGVFAWRAGGAAEQRFERLAAVDFLWQLADPDECFLHAECVRDLDGDGLADLAVPEPEGYRLIAQRRPRAEGAPWGVESRLRVPLESNDEGLWVSASTTEGPSVRGRRSFNFSFAQSSAASERLGPRSLLAISESVPAPVWIDWDADKDLDLVAQTARSLVVWKQDKGEWPAAPSVTLALPVAADRNRRLDASYSSHAVDLDLDARADCVVFAGDTRSEDVRTQGLFFTQGAEKSLFGAEGKPRDLLVFAGFVANPTFVDVDGDGFLDLTLRSVRPDLIDQLRSAANKTIEADLFVYLSKRGVLPRQPDLAWRHSIPIERFELSSEFVGDLTGDGVRDLIVRGEPEKLEALYVRRAPKGGALSVLADPLWQLEIDDDASVRSLALGPKARPELLVIEPKQVLHVRFK